MDRPPSRRRARRARRNQLPAGVGGCGCCADAGRVAAASDRRALSPVRPADRSSGAPLAAVVRAADPGATFWRQALPRRDARRHRLSLQSLRWAGTRVALAALGPPWRLLPVPPGVLCAPRALLAAGPDPACAAAARRLAARRAQPFPGLCDRCEHLRGRKSIWWYQDVSPN